MLVQRKRIPERRVRSRSQIQEGRTRKHAGIAPGVAAGLALLCLVGTGTAQSLPALKPSESGTSLATTSLFKPTRAPVGYRLPSDGSTRRARFVSLEAAALMNVDDVAGGLLKLNLFADANYDGVVTRVERRGPDRYTYSGMISGDPIGHFTFVREGTAVAADVHTLKGNFEIRSVGGGVQSIRQINDTALPGCGSGPEHKGPMVAQKRSEDAEHDGAPVIDVMVVYTGEARAAAGGTDAMQALAQAFVEGANTHFTNSQVNARVRLAHAAEINYVESHNASTELDRLTNPADGYMDEVHVLRDQYGADQVTLLVNQFNYCGIAWLHYGSTRAFSVVDFGCGASTFTHELGHNLGCAHDRQNSSASGYFNYSFGHRFFGVNGSQYRTVMSYSPGTRIPFFSNPGVMYDGVPTGVQEGQSNSADNARTVNQTSITMAAYRQAIDLIDCNDNNLADDDDIASGRSEDCNQNAVPDECDVASNHSQDGNGNNVPDECECDRSQCDDGNPCTVDSCNPGDGSCRNTFGGIAYGDVDQSGVVDIADINCVLAGFDDMLNCRFADIAPCGGDGQIEITDVLAVLDAYNGIFACPSPCP